MKSNAIPKKVLIHTVDYHKYNGDNDWGGDKYDGAQRINNVRVDLSTIYSKSLDQKQIIANGIVFVDAVNSQGIPAGGFIEQSKITFKETNYIITKVIPCYNPTSDTLHHWELEFL